jgi:hypothetical protein
VVHETRIKKLYKIYTARLYKSVAQRVIRIVHTKYTDFIRALYGRYTGLYGASTRSRAHSAPGIYGQSIRTIYTDGVYRRFIQSGMSNVTPLQILYTEIYTETTR